VGILLWQTVGWLRSGVWPVLPLSKVIGSPLPQIEGWIGATQVLWWIFDLPMTLVLFCLGCLLIVLAPRPYKSSRR
jgi:hypothetical protein